MKKILLIPLLIAACCTQVHAQENDGLVYPNTFYGSLAVGGFGYAHSGEFGLGAPAVNLTAGVWLSSPLAFQLSFDGVMGSNAAGNNSLFLIAGGEFKWDANSTLFHVYNQDYLRPIPFYPLIGLGVMWLNDISGSSHVDNSFQMMLGLQAPFRLMSRMDAILQYKCYFLPQGFDNSHGDNYLHLFGLGLMFRQADDPFHRRTERYTRSIAEDWFFGLGIGPNYSAFDLFNNSNSGGLAMIGVAPELMVGRNFSNFWTVRIMLGGLVGHEQYDTILETAESYRYSFLHADLMLNVSNLISRDYGVSLNVMPYFGAGPVWRYDDPVFDLAGNVGVMLRYYLSRKSDLYLDCRYVVVPPHIGGGVAPSGKYYSVGLPSVTLGYIFNFGQNSTRYRMPLNKCPGSM